MRDHLPDPLPAFLDRVRERSRPLVRATSRQAAALGGWLRRAGSGLTGERRLLVAVGLALCFGLALFSVLLFLALRLSVPDPLEVEEQRSESSVLWSAASRVEVGDRLSPDLLRRYLETAGFRPASAVVDAPRPDEPGAGEPEPAPASPGPDASGDPAADLPARSFHRSGDDEPRIALRYGDGVAVVGFRGDHVVSVTVDGEDRDQLVLPRVELAVLTGDDLMDRRVLDLDDAPEHLLRAVLAAEDDQFWTHHGMSMAGILRAATANVRAGRIVQGASTLTQQVARNLFLTQERSWARKVREARLALAIEARWSKEEILESYLNTVYLGARDGRQLVGVRTASLAFFGVEPDRLTLAESALLAGMISSPGRFDPVAAQDEALGRRDRVLGQMARLGWIGSDDLEMAIQEPLRLRAVPEDLWVDHFASRAVAETLTALDEESVVGRGLQLFATLDWFDQRAALDTLGTVEDREAALVSMDPSSGAVLSYLGGVPGTRSAYDRAARARRPIGSLAKPFAYAAAFGGRRMLPGSTVFDVPIEVRYDDEVWLPGNDDGRYHGVVDVATALRLSLNAASLRVALAGGLRETAELMQELGLTDVAEGPSLALGAVDATPLEMAVAYGAFADAGRHRPARFLDAIRRRDGSEVELERPEPRQVLDEPSAYLLYDTLRGVVSSGTAWRVGRALPDEPIAGKTGTSNEGRDAWFVGYSADRVTSVWTGHDDFSAGRGSGGDRAAPLFATFTRGVRPAAGFVAQTRPEEVRWASLGCSSAAEGWVPTDLSSEARESLCDPLARSSSLWQQLEHVAETPVRRVSLPGAADQASGRSSLGGRRSSPLLVMAAMALVRRGWTEETVPGDEPPLREIFTLDGPLGGIRERSWSATPALVDVVRAQRTLSRVAPVSPRFGATTTAGG